MADRTWNVELKRKIEVTFRTQVKADNSDIATKIVSKMVGEQIEANNFPFPHPHSQHPSEYRIDDDRIAFVSVQEAPQTREGG